jgi:hypothetical protein
MPAPGPTSRLVYIAFTAITLSWVLTGCATVLSGHPQPLNDTGQEVQTVMEAANANALLACLKTPTETCRDQLVGARMYAADLRFAEFEAQLFKEGRGAGFGASVGALGLSAAATASTGGTAQALSAANTLLLGTRESYQRDLLGEQTTAAIHTAMQARRKSVALRLRAGLGQPLKAYPLPVALNDLTAYVRAGSLIGALTEITDTVAVSANAVERELKDSVVADYAARDASAKSIEQALCGDAVRCDKPDERRREKLKLCASQAGLTMADATVALVDGTSAISAATRQSVLACLTKP